MKISATGFERQYSAYNRVSPAFSGSGFFLRRGNSISPRELEDEVTNAQKARDYGADVPKYRVRYDEEGIKQIRYTTKGDKADIKTNRIRFKHFNALFKNLYYLDSAGIFHNRLDSDHIFLQDDGHVEFDCFRDSLNYYKNGSGLGVRGIFAQTPDFMMHSNEDSFKENYLSELLDTLEDKYYFMYRYLKESGKYHQNRAELLIRRGSRPTGKAVKYETMLSEVFSPPSGNVIDFETDKLNFYKQKRAALKGYDEKGEPQKSFEAVVLRQLDCFELALNLQDKSRYLSENSYDEKHREYFKIEAERAQKMLEAFVKKVEETDFEAFCAPGNKASSKTEDEKEFFLLLIQNIDFSNSAKAKEAIDEIRTYYKELQEE